MTGTSQHTLPSSGGRVTLSLLDQDDQLVVYQAVLDTPSASYTARMRMDVASGQLDVTDELPSAAPAWLNQLACLLLRTAWRSPVKRWPRRIKRWRAAPKREELD